MINLNRHTGFKSPSSVTKTKRRNKRKLKKHVHHSLSYNIILFYSGEYLDVAKYHLGKVKPERVGQRLPPSQYVTFGAALRALLTLVFFAAFVAFAVLLCFAC